MAAQPRVAGPGLKLRAQLLRRRLTFGLAVRLIRGQDGVVVSATAWHAALDRLARLAEWPVGTRRQREALAAHVEDTTRLLVLAGEAGDPALQLAGLQERYVNIRMRAMSKAKRERLQYEAAMHALEKRIVTTSSVAVTYLKRPATCEHAHRVTPEGQYTKFKCFDCGTVGDVKKETT